ncbi:hypothetical protein IRZ70_11545 [Pseudomonas monteilii]|nr:hypothetical protein [Pseudomonas monteilii]
MKPTLLLESFAKNFTANSPTTDKSTALEGISMSGTFEQGWAARPFAQQFPEMNADEAKRLDHINTSITTLYLAGLLTDKQANEIRTKKFPKVVTKAVLGKR